MSLLDSILDSHVPDVPMVTMEALMDATAEPEPEPVRDTAPELQATAPAPTADDLMALMIQPNIDVAAIIATINAARAAAGVTTLDPTVPAKAPKGPKIDPTADPKWVAAGLKAAETRRINAERKAQGLPPISQADKAKSDADPKWVAAGLKAAATRKEREALGLPALNTPKVNPINTSANMDKFRAVFLRQTPAEPSQKDTTRAEVAA